MSAAAARVVVLAYYFPPLAGIASERAFSLSHHLRERGWDVVVVTARDGFYHRSPESSNSDVPVIATRSVELSRAARRMYAGRHADDTDSTVITPVDAGNVGRRARGLIRDFVYIPDAQVGWIPFAAAATYRLLRRWPGPRAVYSSSVPYSAHVAARLAARRAGAGWVAEFRDPWSTSASPYRSQNRLRRRIDAGLEDRMLRSADHVVCTTESLRASLMEAHGLDAGQISVITNGFEPIPERQATPPDQPMTILYAGTVSAGEDMRPVLALLDELFKRRPRAFRLRVLGPTAPWESASPTEPDRPWLELPGVVSPAQAREAMAESSVLLLVQAHPAYRDALPGKVFEYIGARRPILAICPPMIEMLDVMASHGDVRHVVPDDREGLLRALEELIEEHRAGDLQAPRVQATTTAPLRRSEQVGQLAAVLSAASQPQLGMSQ